MSYELFNRKREHGGPSAVTVTKFGNFVINSTGLSLFKKQKYVHVYWDKDNSKVGLKPLPKKEDKSYSINYSPKGGVGSLSATAFLKHIGYPIKATTSFPAHWNEKEQMLEFQIIYEKGGAPKRFPRIA